MKTLELNQMENIQAGGWLDCLGFALGVIGTAVAIASVPVTGPIGAGLATGLATGAIGTGISGAGCLETFIK